METVLEQLRFNRVARFETKKYVKGTYRRIINRTYCGFLFCLEGKVTYMFDGEEFVGDKEHVILAPGKSNYELYVNEDCIIPILNFELDHGVFDRMYCFEIEETESFYRSFLQMEKKFIFSKTSSELMCLSAIYDLTARINGYGKKDSRFNIIEKAEKYLEENIYKKSLTVSDVAKNGNISEVYFRKVFKVKHNMSPNKYINEIRIEKAKNMLIDEDADICEISEECGFSSIYTFSRAFKNHVGISPAYFKKKHLVSD